MKRILGIVMPAQDAAANAHDHIAVTPHEDFERQFIPAGDELFEELIVGQREQVAQEDEAASEAVGRHVASRRSGKAWNSTTARSVPSLGLRRSA